MTTRSKFLRPAIAVIAALVVGATSAILGASLTAPDAVDVAATAPLTRTVPVIAPIAIGDEAPPAADTDSEYMSVSTVVAERVLPIDSGDSETPPTDGIHIDAAAESDDLATILGDPPSDPGGDPCAPTEGESAEECPDGIRGAVFSLTAPPEPFVAGIAFPPSLAEYLDGGARGGTVYCETPVVVGEAEVPLGIVTPVPATLSVQYWPTARPEEVRDGPAVATSAEATASWEAEFAASERDYPAWLQHCFTLPGIEPDTAYTAKVVAVDIFDRIAVSRDITFHSSGEATKPGLVVHGISNLMFASAMHTHGETVTIQAWKFGPDATPNCAGTGGVFLSPLKEKTTDVSVQRLRELNIIENNTKKLTQPYAAPEGTTVLACARWFPGGASPSWERGEATRQSEVLVQTPDRILPVATLEEMTSTGDPAVLWATLRLSSVEGVDCGGGDVIPVPELPRIMCAAESLATGGAQMNPRWEIIRDPGFSGDLLATSRVKIDGESDYFTASVILPLRDRMCVGSCELPPAEWFPVPMPAKAGIMPGLCGILPPAECTPPTRDVLAGTALIKVEWVHGDTNGRSSWSILPAVDTAADLVGPDVPQLNTDRAFVVTMDAGNRQARAQFTLEADRDVDYTVRLTQGDGTEPACVNEFGRLEATGHAGSPTVVRFTGLCIGEQYTASVELVDADGHRAVWGLVDRSSWWGENARFDVPGFQANLTYRWGLSTPGLASLDEYEIRVGDWGGFNALHWTGSRCTEGGIMSRNGAGGPYEYRDVVAVRLLIGLAPAIRQGDRCLADPDSTIGRISQTVMVDLDDLLSPEGAVIRFEEPFGFSLVLRARAAG